jgi:hypothetical protein
VKTKFSIECVDAHALYHALLRQQAQSTGNGVSNVEFDTGVPCMYCHGSEQPPALLFTIERFAMDGNGHHVGYEAYLGHLPLYALKPVRTLGGATPFSEWYVIPRSLDVARIVPAREPYEYTVEDALFFLREWFEGEDDPVLEPGLHKDFYLSEAFDRGMGDADYVPPDEDFAYHELERALGQALDDLPEGLFHSDDEGRYWTLQFDDGEVVDTHWIERKE